jgi:predicted Na+-dependent transporter
MKKEVIKFVITLIVALLLLLAIVLGYAWFAGRSAAGQNKPVAVCGGTKTK